MNKAFVKRKYMTNKASPNHKLMFLSDRARAINREEIHMQTNKKFLIKKTDLVHTSYSTLKFLLSLPYAVYLCKAKDKYVKATNHSFCFFSRCFKWSEMDKAISDNQGNL